jgi:hypothetical protein
VDSNDDDGCECDFDIANFIFDKDEVGILDFEDEMDIEQTDKGINNESKIQRIVNIEEGKERKPMDKTNIMKKLLNKMKRIRWKSQKKLKREGNSLIIIGK